MKKLEIKKGFLKDTNIKENVYLLGFLWADGYVSPKGNLISLAITQSDMIHIDFLFKKWINVKIHTRQRKYKGLNFGKPVSSIAFSDYEISSFLKTCDYTKKSYMSQEKIIEKIPQNLVKYFWRGYFDGDGSLFVGKRVVLAFWSSINQNWDTMLGLLSDLGITRFSIYKYERKEKKHKSSCLRIGNREDILKFLNYIYGDYDQIGLERKFKKYIEIKSMRPKQRKTSTHRGICFEKRINKWFTTASVDIEGKRKLFYLGKFSTELESKAALDNFFVKNPQMKLYEKPKRSFRHFNCEK